MISTIADDYYVIQLMLSALNLLEICYPSQKTTSQLHCFGHVMFLSHRPTPLWVLLNNIS